MRNSECGMRNYGRGRNCGQSEPLFREATDLLSKDGILYPPNHSVNQKLFPPIVQYLTSNIDYLLWRIAADGAPQFRIPNCLTPEV